MSGCVIKAEAPPEMRKHDQIGGGGIGEQLQNERPSPPPLLSSATGCPAVMLARRGAAAASGAAAGKCLLTTMPALWSSKISAAACAIGQWAAFPILTRKTRPLSANHTGFPNGQQVVFTV
jgi:hypothetical protein